MKSILGQRRKSLLRVLIPACFECKRDLCFNGGEIVETENEVEFKTILRGLASAIVGSYGDFSRNILRRAHKLHAVFPARTEGAELIRHIPAGASPRRSRRVAPGA
jgi:hypothetical protein